MGAAWAAIQIECATPEATITTAVRERDRYIIPSSMTCGSRQKAQQQLLMDPGLGRLSVGWLRKKIVVGTRNLKKHFNDGSRLLWVPFDSSLCFLSLPRGAARTACLSLFAISFPMAGLGYLCEYLDSMWAPSPNGRWKKPLWIFLFIVFIFVLLLLFFINPYKFIQNNKKII